MATTDILPFSTGGTNDISPAGYAALTSLLANGFQSGTALSNQINTVLRQSSFMSAGLANWCVVQGVSIPDDRNMNKLVTEISAAFAAYLAANGFVAGGGGGGTTGSYDALGAAASALSTAQGLINIVAAAAAAAQSAANTANSTASNAQSTATGAANSAAAAASTANNALANAQAVYDHEFGINQSIYNVLGQRNSGVTYYNTSSKPMLVMGDYHGPGGMSFFLNGTIVFNLTAALTDSAPFVLIVPVGMSYSGLTTVGVMTPEILYEIK